MERFQQQRRNWLKRTYKMSPQHYRKGKPFWSANKLNGGCRNAPDIWREWIGGEYGGFFTTGDHSFSPNGVFVRMRIRPWIKHRDRLTMTRRGKWLVRKPCKEDDCDPRSGIHLFVRHYVGYLRGKNHDIVSVRGDLQSPSHQRRNRTR